jgi:hypothetical protein
MNSVYAYQDVDRNTVMAGETTLNFTGTWSSAGTYSAANKDVVDYGTTKYIAIIDNVGGIPTYIPRRTAAKWSTLALIRQGDGSDPIEVAGTVVVNLGGDELQTARLTGDAVFRAIGVEVNKEVEVRVLADGTYAMSFDTDWTFLGQKPTEIAGVGIGMLTVSSFGTRASDILAKWEYPQ